MNQHVPELKIFAGNSNPPLAEEISEYLRVALGKAVVETFSDGESKVEIKENVRGADVFVIQSTSAPGNDNLMELLLMLDAFKRASAKRITAVVPYYGSARPDQREVDRRFDYHRRRFAHADAGSSLRPDPGVFRHPGG